jgi:hypothetical protein
MIFTISTFNVWNAKGKRLYKIIDFLRKNEFSVIGLQEIGEKELTIIAKELKMNYIWTGVTHIGNGMLIHCSMDIKNHKTYKLSTYTGEIRTAIYAYCKTPIGNLSIVTTHLDHINETTRIDQWNILQTIIPKNIDIIIGDFNSLYLEDYSTEKLNKITKIRQESSWELPTDKLMQSIKKDGWVIYNYTHYRSVWFTSCHIFFSTIIYEIQCLIYQ